MPAYSSLPRVCISVRAIVCASIVLGSLVFAPGAWAAQPPAPAPPPGAGQPPGPAPPPKAAPPATTSAKEPQYEVYEVDEEQKNNRMTKILGEQMNHKGTLYKGQVL